MRILKNLLTTLVILWGLVALIGRIVTPLIGDYRDQLAGLLGDALQAPVAITHLQARWYGLQPVLELGGVTIGEAPAALEVARISLDLSPSELLAGSALAALHITVDGLQLTLVREPTGQIHLEGMGPVGPETQPMIGLPPLPSHVRLINTRVVWIDRKAGKAPYTLDEVDVVLDRDGSILKLRASLATTSGRAVLAAQLDGFLATRDWDGESYLKVDNLDVADLFAHYLPPTYGLHSMQLSLEAWSSWQDAAPLQSQGKFQLRDLNLHPRTEGAAALQLAGADARFSFQREPNGVRVGLKDLQLTFGDHQWPAANLAFAWSRQPDGSNRIAAAADYLRVDDLVRILQVRLPWSHLKQPFELLQPRGELRDLRLVTDIADGHFGWRGRARFDGIAVAPWGRAPGVENLSGSLHGQQDHLMLQLDSRDTTLRFNELFRDPLELRVLSGRLDLLRQGDGWQLVSERLLADSPHIQTRTRLRLEQHPDRPLFLDLQTDFGDGDAAFAGLYYPTGIMSSNLVHWLDTAIKSGQVAGGTALLHGSLGEFPFHDPSSGTFQVVFDTRDVELDYRQGWPKLEHVDARLKFNANSLDIDLHTGAILDSRVVEARGRIDSLAPTGPLQVRGLVRGPLQDNLRILQQDALRDRFGHIAEALRGQGDTELRLDFALALSKLGQTRLDGELQFGGAALSLPDWNLTLSDIAGRLDFTLDGVSATAVKARALGAPVVVDVTRLADGATRVSARGRLQLDDVRRQFPALPLQVAGGAADFVIGVDVPAHGAQSGKPTVLSVNSDLKGVQVNLPAPFGKPAAATRSLALRLPLHGRAAVGSFDYAGEIKASFSGDRKRIDVVLGGAEAKLPTDPGIHVGGRLQRVDLWAWNTALEPLSLGGAGSQLPITLDLYANQVVADAAHVDQLQLSATYSKGLWRGIVDAPNLAGSFIAPDALTELPIQVQLQRLALKLPLGGDEPVPAQIPDPAGGPDPATLPGLVLSIADLKINEARLGQLRFEAQRAPEGLRLTQLSLRDGQVELDSAGHWSRSEGSYETRWGGRVSTANLGDLLVDLGYTRQVEEARSSIEWLLHWPGNPAQFHRATVDGEVSLDVGTGRLVELDPGVTRVVGLLNLNALTRRLRLDFSDFYKKGYSFDTIKGDFKFGGGKASTDNLSVLGPTGRIDLDGSADLVARMLDQHVAVTPNLDATLPIAGTLAGGPVAGLAVLVAQKVMTKQVDQINRFEYRLRGPWGEPEVTQLDTGGTLSKILKPFSSGGQPPPASDNAQPETPAATAPDPADDAAAAENGATAEPDAEAEQEEPQTRNPLRGLLDMLRNSTSPATEEPGAQQ